MRMIACPSKELTEGERIQAHVNELCSQLRQITLPPSWMDQSEEGVKKWRSI